MRTMLVGAVAAIAVLGSGGALVVHVVDDHDADRARGEKYAAEHNLDHEFLPPRVQYPITQCTIATRALYPDAASFGYGAQRQPAAAVAFWNGCTGGNYYGD